MGTLYLSVELAFDMLACIIGCVLTFQAKDNNQKRYWGMMPFVSAQSSFGKISVG